MLFESLSWVIFTLTLLVALPGALASTAPKKTKKTPAALETYSAMEDDEDSSDVPAPQNRRVQTLGSLAPVGAPLAARSTIVVTNDQPAATPETFEVVPSDKRPQVLQRMRLCETLFQETGRAYDYRTMTTASLKRELTVARSASRPSVASTTDRDPILSAEE